MRVPGWVGSLLLVMVSLGVAGLVVEGLVRVFFDELVQPRIFVDGGYGVRANEAHADMRHYVPGDYDIRITTNAAGQRGQKDYPVARQPDVGRVLVLGDSFAFGFGVEDREVVSSVLEELLTAQGRPTEVINLAVSGFGQAEELVTWRERGRQYDADAVVIFYFDNDIGNNAVSGLFDVTPDGEVVATGKSYLPGVAALQALYRIPPIRWLFFHSEAWNLIRNRLSGIVQNTMLRKQGLKSFDDVQPVAVDLTRALLLELIAEIKAAGAQPIIVAIPNANTGMGSNFPLDAAALGGLGVTFLDGRQFVTKADYFKRDSHWRPSGHRKAAEGLALELTSPSSSNVTSP